MKIVVPLLMVTLATGGAGLATAQEHFNNRSPGSETLLLPLPTGPVRYNTVLYDQTYGNRAATATPDHFNQKSVEAYPADRGYSNHYGYPIRPDSCWLVTENHFDERSNPHRVCQDTQRLGPPPLVKGE